MDNKVKVKIQNSKNVLINEEDIQNFLSNPRHKPNTWEWRICPICGKNFYARKKYKKITCSEICYNKYIDEHRDEISAKISMASYNAYHSKTKEQIEMEHAKARKTCLEKYGYEKPQKSPAYRKKMSKMFSERDWSYRSEKIKNEALIPKYQKICENDKLELIEFRNRFDCTVKCKECGSVFDIHVLGYLTNNTTHDLCRTCHPILLSHDTKPVKFIEDIIKCSGLSYKRNDRFILKPYEIDILIPSLKIGFEVNGNYWHSELIGGRDKNYHINKTKLAESNGYKLIQIYEDEIVNKPEIVKSRVLNILGLTPNRIFARKCILKEISYKEKHTFLNNNHIDGDSVSQKNIALFYNDEIVCVATFGSRTVNKKKAFELIRFANKLDTSVIGGFSKIMKYFTETYQPESLITYADIRWSGISYKDTVYAKNGFVFDGYTKPNYFYMDKKAYLKRLNRLNFTKQKLVKMGYDSSKTEMELMFEHGYDRIWDCGSMRFIFFPR